VEIIFTGRRPRQQVSNLENGDLFKLPAGTTVYMRINNPHFSLSNNCSVVNLGNGNVYDFESSRGVILLEGELSVEER